MDKFLVKKTKPDSGADPEVTKEGNGEETTTQNDRRKFRKEWMGNFSWLQERDGRAFCKACEKPLINHITHLKVHQEKAIHKKNVNEKKNQITMDCFASTSQESLSKQIRDAEYTLVMFCINHNLPLLLMNFLPMLLYTCCPDSKIAKELKCARTKSKNVAATLAEKSKAKILQHLRTSKFSLIVDETTDISTRKALVLVVRYFDTTANIIRDRFLSLIELFQSDAQSIYESIKNFFFANHIPMENLIGLATDGANTMAGEFNGLKTKFTSSSIFYQKCTCHSLHLCSSYACKTLPAEIETFCRNVYKYFSYSPKRIQELKEFQEYCGVKPHAILGIASTRWLSLESVIGRIVEQWVPLRLYFTNCVLEVNGIKPYELANVMMDSEIKVYLLFLSYILKIINDLNKEFQSETIRLPYLYSRLDTHFKLFLSHYIKDNVLKDLSTLHNFDVADEQKFMPTKDVFIGSKAEAFLASDLFSESDRIVIKTNIRNFILELLRQMQKRFDFGREDLKCLSLIIPSQALSEESILPLINNFSYLVQCDVDILTTQWKLLRLQSKSFNTNLPIPEFWEKVKGVKNGLGESCFKELCDFITNLMCLPHSSAAAERKFFDLSLIKTKLRNRLEFESVNNIMLCKELSRRTDGSNYVWSPKDSF